MWITVRFQNGSCAEVLILAGNRDEALVVVEGRRNAEQWRVSEGRLHDEAGEAVEIEAMLALAGFDCAELCAQLQPMTASAGGRWN